jgi:hypothetical protein
MRFERVCPLFPMWEAFRCGDPSVVALASCRCSPFALRCPDSGEHPESVRGWFRRLAETILEMIRSHLLSAASFPLSSHRHLADDLRFPGSTGASPIGFGALAETNVGGTSSGADPGADHCLHHLLVAASCAIRSMMQTERPYRKPLTMRSCYDTKPSCYASILHPGLFRARI